MLGLNPFSTSHCLLVLKNVSFIVFFKYTSFQYSSYVSIPLLVHILNQADEAN